MASTTGKLERIVGTAAVAAAVACAAAFYVSLGAIFIAIAIWVVRSLGVW